MDWQSKGKLIFTFIQYTFIYTFKYNGKSKGNGWDIYEMKTNNYFLHGTWREKRREQKRLMMLYNYQ